MLRFRSCHCLHCNTILTHHFAPPVDRSARRSPIKVAIRSHNSHFISHPLVQEYVEQIWKGDDPLQSHFGEEEDRYMAWDFVLQPKKFFGSPRGHFFLYIYTYIIFITFQTIVSNKLSFEVRSPLNRFVILLSCSF